MQSFLEAIYIRNEIFKKLLTKRYLIRYYYFSNISIVCQNRDFMLVKFGLFNFSITKLYDFLIYFYIYFQFIYNFYNR